MTDSTDAFEEGNEYKMSHDRVTRAWHTEIKLRKAKKGCWSPFTRFGFVNTCMLLRDFGVSIFKLYTYTMVFVDSWPMNRGADKPDVNSLHSVVGPNTGSLIQAYLDFVVVMYFLARFIWWIVHWLKDRHTFAGIKRAFRNVDNNKDGVISPQELLKLIDIMSMTAEEAEQRWDLNGNKEITFDEFCLGDCQDGIQYPDKILVFAHYWAYKLCTYSTFKYAVYWMNEFLTLQAFKSQYIESKEGDKKTTVIEYIKIGFMVPLLTLKGLAAIFVVIIKMSFYSSVLLKFINAPISTELTATNAENYANVAIVFLDIVSIASMGYQEMLQNFFLSRAMEGKSDDMLEIISHFKGFTWYITKFAYEDNYVRLQHLIKLSFLTQSANTRVDLEAVLAEDVIKKKRRRNLFGKWKMVRAVMKQTKPDASSPVVGTVAVKYSSPLTVSGSMLSSSSQRPFITQVHPEPDTPVDTDPV